MLAGGNRDEKDDPRGTSLGLQRADEFFEEGAFVSGTFDVGSMAKD
jgi:hypothetical protein